MSILIRTARPDDAAKIGALLRRMAPAFVPDPGTPEAAPFLESLGEAAVVERLEAPSYLHLVAERGADFCGYLAVRDRSHLYHLFVRPDLHGQGIARLLWLELLRVNGPGPYTVNSSVPAVGVYRRFGFAPYGEPRLDGCPPYVPMIRVRGD